MSRVHISLLLVMIGFVVAMPPANAERLPLPEVESSDIEYPNVAVAWSQLEIRERMADCGGSRFANGLVVLSA
jgi:hypothetical protein